MKPLAVALRTITLLLALATAAAAEPMPAPAMAQLRAIFQRAEAPGMVAAIVDGENTYFASFGVARAGRDAPPDERSLLRLNSLSKLMAGEIFSSLLAQHRLALDDPLQAYAPRGRNVPRFPGRRTITLRDILIHTSGLPRDLPTSLAQVTLDERWQWLERTRPLRPPGRIAQYSNAAYMFLGDALARASGADFATLLAIHVTAPLRLDDTTLDPTQDQCRRLMTNGRDDQACAPTRETGASAGIYSTAFDMAHWMRAALAHPSRPLAKRAELQRLIAMDMAGRTEAIGLGWLHMRLDQLAVMQKTGGGGGFMNYVILAPERHLAIFVTVSRTDIEMLRRLARQTNALLLTLARER